jgi:hypothetical protein
MRKCVWLSSLDLHRGSKERSTMTIVMVMAEATKIWIGADVQLSEPDIELQSTIGKLQKHPTAPVAWGTSGNPALGIDQFSPWLKSYPWPPTSINQFRDDVAAQVARINGKQREHCKLAGIELPLNKESDELFSLLLAAWLDDAPLVIWIDYRGVQSAVSSLPFEAIGAGRAHAKIINTTLNQLVNKNLFHTSFERFRFTLTLASQIALSCSTPVMIWEVSKKGVALIASGKK